MFPKTALLAKNRSTIHINKLRVCVNEFVLRIDCAPSGLCCALLQCVTLQPSLLSYLTQRASPLR